MTGKKKFFGCLLVVALVLTMAPAVWAQDAEKININKASVEQLTKLKNVGTKYAERIVKYRDEKGSFKSPEDIMKVKGIGSKTFEVNKEKITVD